MKQQILELIKAGQFELAKTLVESQVIEFDWRQESERAAEENELIINIQWNTMNSKGAVQYCWDTNTFGGGMYFFDCESHVLWFCLKWTGDELAL